MMASTTSVSVDNHQNVKEISFASNCTHGNVVSLLAC